MSEKVKFVRNTAALFVAAHWEKPDAERAVRLASALWKRLADFGFGDKPDAKPKPRKPDADYYAQLTGKHKEEFDKLYEVYNLKQGRNEAAMRWLQLLPANSEVLTDEEYRQIRSAAQAEAAKPRHPDERRKYLQGWLTERRWLDYLESKDVGIKSKASAKAARYRELATERESAARMQSILPQDDQNRQYWETEVKRLDAAIEELRQS